MENHQKMPSNHRLLLVEEEVKDLIQEKEEAQVDPSQDLDQKHMSKQNSPQIIHKEEEEEDATTIIPKELISQMCNAIISRNMVTLKVNAGRNNMI